MNQKMGALHALCCNLETKNFRCRLQEICDLFLGVAYGPWEDGTTYESLDDFNYTLEVLDCVTFVEVVLAAAKTRPHIDVIDFCHDFEKLLCNIHYAKGVSNFISRNHFMCLDWLENNKFIVDDITESLWPQTEKAIAQIDKINWCKKHKITANPLARLPENVIANLSQKTSILSYINTDELLNNPIDFYARFPEYCIVNIVRPNWDLTEKIGTHLNISHLGFVFKEPKQQELIFYHASSEAKQVIKVPFLQYMQQTKQIPSIQGFNVQVISSGYYNAR